MSESLPSSANLTHLKHQAKALLKAHQRGDASCCEVLRQLHQFADLPDVEILAAAVKLDDVHFALAMNYGFESWAKLRAHVEGLSGEKLKSAVVYGQVTSEATGEPIEGVDLTFELIPTTIETIGDSHLHTDTDGRFEWVAQWRGDYLPEMTYQCCHQAYACIACWASEPGSELTRRQRLDDGGRYEVNQALREGYTFELSVQNELGEPVEGAEIILLPGGATLEMLDGMGYNPYDPSGWPKTDSEGHCRIEGLDAHLSEGYRCPVNICHEDHRDHVISDAGALPREGHVARATVSLPTGVCLSGRVICAETGRPVAGADIYASPSRGDVASSDPNETRGRGGVTGTDGSFSLRGLRACRHGMSVRSEGWVHKQLTDVDVASAEPLEIRLERGRVISGEVIGPDGRPVAKARIDAYGSGTDRHYWENVMEADDSGRFEMGGVSTDGPLLMVAGHYVGAYCAREISPNERHVVFDARKLVELEGMVVDAAGKPISTRVQCNAGMDWMGEPVTLGMMPISDDDGVFRVRLPANGTVSLDLSSHDGFGASTFFNRHPITMQDGKPDRSLIFVANPFCKLALRFVDARTDAPAGRVRVSLRTSMGNYDNEDADDDGLVVFPYLPRYDVKLRAVAEGYETIAGESISLPADEEVVIRLTPKD